tara:strand:- start:191 stop:376 length:186 start_codon:yes stop_codon:yes gene_type:complete
MDERYQKDLEKMYDRLLANCDIAIERSEKDSWAFDFWTSTKEELYRNMSDLGILKNNRTVH